MKLLTLPKAFLVFAITAASIYAYPGDARADDIVLDFDLPSLPSGGGNGYEEILNYYDGGTDQYGDVGPSDGITFSDTALALGQYPDAPNSNTGNEPGGGNGLIFLSGTEATMNVPVGFTTGFSFYYDAPSDDSGSINVWSGPNDTGTLLATLDLPGTSTNSDEPYYANWTPIGVTFSGTAESVDFAGTENYIAFADVTLNSGTPSEAAPEPSTWALLVGGIGLLAFVRLRRARKA